MRTTLAVLLFAAPVIAQSNAVPGLDVITYDLNDVRVYGRRGPAFPNGEIGLNVGHSMCNRGSVALPWTGGSFSGVMLQTYPKIATLIARDDGMRMVQVSGKSHAKHSRIAFNFQSGPCAPCQNTMPNHWNLGCSDTYSAGFSSLSTLGPTDEIDPWLGVWEPVGSYFDRGDPEVSGPAAMDGIRSSITSSDPLYNRVMVPESELAAGGNFYAQVVVVIIGEPVASRDNNYTTKGFRFNRSGTSWSGTTTSGVLTGSVLHHWSGATTAAAGNGTDDGRFMVGCKVTGPVNGMWHYELAVHNLDNHSGGAAFRLPICPTARVENADFRDIDKNLLNEWSYQRTASEISWMAPAGNALNWNTIYNVSFDSDAAPTAGMMAIDRARLGPGALTVSVPAQVPGTVGNEYVGDGCGAVPPALFANGLPEIPNPGYELAVQGAGSVPTLLVASLAGDNAALGSGCFRYINLSSVALTDIRMSNSAGRATWSLPIPAGLSTFDLHFQAAQLVSTGPYLGADLSNGLRVRVGGTGCP